jgi:hypothetical protein
MYGQQRGWQAPISLAAYPLLLSNATHPAVLYSLGCRRNPHARDIVARLIAVGAIIVDIRGDPDSEQAGWRRSDLQGWLNGPS